MKDTALVIMAAGIGSRYGGNKQIDGIGPNGETLMEYSIYDAVRAGFNQVVLIVKPEMEPVFRNLFGDRLSNCVQITYAYQDFSNLPDFYRLPPTRTRPFGTGHALLQASRTVKEPFCVINADDYYGSEAYRLMFSALQTLPEEGQSVMVGYPLKNTASLHGSVSRGLCTVENGCLSSIREVKKIQMYPDGHLQNLEDGQALDPDTIVSMNCWGFTASVFPSLQRYFESFLRTEGQDITAECMLPSMIQDEMKSGRLTVRVLTTGSRWFGMTYRQDRELVAAELRRLHQNGDYPPSLRV